MEQTYSNYYKEYYQKNKERINAKRKGKYHNKAKVRYEKNKTNNGKGELSYSRQWKMWYAAKQRAKKTGLPFNIEISDVVIPKVCPILGITLDTDYLDKTMKSSPSLDKIVPSKGYVKGNIAVISKQANFMKQDLTLETIDKLVKYIKKYYKPEGGSE